MECRVSWEEESSAVHGAVTTEDALFLRHFIRLSEYPLFCCSEAHPPLGAVRDALSHEERFAEISHHPREAILAVLFNQVIAPLIVGPLVLLTIHARPAFAAGMILMGVGPLAGSAAAFAGIGGKGDFYGLALFLSPA